MWYSNIKKIISYFVLFVILIPGICYSQNNSQESRDSEPGPNWDHSPEDYWPFPSPDAGYVSDHANLLGREKEEEIETSTGRIKIYHDFESFESAIGELTLIDFEDLPEDGSSCPYYQDSIPNPLEIAGVVFTNRPPHCHQSV